MEAVTTGKVGSATPTISNTPKSDVRAWGGTSHSGVDVQVVERSGGKIFRVKARGRTWSIWRNLGVEVREDGDMLSWAFATITRLPKTPEISQ